MWNKLTSALLKQMVFFTCPGYLQYHQSKPIDMYAVKQTKFLTARYYYMNGETLKGPDKPSSKSRSAIQTAPHQSGIQNDHGALV